MNLNWMVRMAWRDSRRQRGRLVLFMSSIVLGIAAMVAINSFGDQLQQQLDSEAQALLGADIEVQSQFPIPSEIEEFLDSLQIEISREISFGSMVQFDAQGATRLVNVRAIDGRYPFYGQIETRPEGLAAHLSSDGKALAAEGLLLQYGISPGDSIGIGELKFELAGSVTKVPGQTGITGSVAPPVFMPYHLTEATGLLQKGSRINYKIYGKYPPGFDPKLFQSLIKPRLQAAELRSDDVEERKSRTGAIFSDLTGFLNLTAFVALLLGCIGVASSAHLYVKEKVKQVAVLRCLGASGRESAGIYMLQLLGIAIPAAAVGALFGSAMQVVIPPLVADFLPVSVEAGISWSAIFSGILVGVITAMIFALPPLLRIAEISPLQVLRAEVDSRSSNKLRGFILGTLTFLYIFAFAAWQMGSALQASFFIGGLIFSLILLTGIARGMMWLVRRYMPLGGSFVLRQGLSNLYRPNNQTLVLMVTIGLGTGLITTLLLSQNLLTDKLQQASAGSDRPNMVLFDIQDEQLDSLRQLTVDFGFPVIGDVPIVNMRLHSLKGQTVTQLKADTTQTIRNSILTREYRVTYRDSITEAETIADGRWTGTYSGTGRVPVSLSDNMAKDMQVQIGDPLIFNVQGAMIECEVGSIRKVDWQRVQTNFVLVFPAGVLESAPKFHVLLTRFGTVAESAEYQAQMVKQFPNISIIDLNLVLETIDEVGGKAAFVIQFMALISMLTGLIVLIASVRTSKFQRIREGVLLRTLGASGKKLFWI